MRVACWLAVAWLALGALMQIHATRMAIAERNLEQAEGMLKACFAHRRFVVGTAIYRCEATMSELTTAHFPEFRGQFPAVF